jgi:predicted phage terminase large subunit-like protein
VIKLGEIVMILDLHRQGLTVSAIARELGVDRKTVRKCIARGLEPPVYGPRKPRERRIDPFVGYLRERVTAYPSLTGRRLLRELRERGYEGGYTAITDTLREIRPARLPAFEVRFETPPGEQAQVDFAQFQLQFTDEPAVTRVVWLFSFVLGFSRLIWARFVLHQDMQTVLRCHMAAFEAIGGVPHEILYDRMKTAVIGEAGGSIVYNRALIDFARHYGYQPKACRPYRAKTKGKVERPYRYIREDFFLARSQIGAGGRGALELDSRPPCALSQTETGDYSACVVLLQRNEVFYILDVVRGRFPFDRLKRKVMEVKRRYGSSTLLIEDSPISRGLIQSLREQSINVTPYKPDTDKRARVIAQTDLFVGGSVRFPRRAAWLEEFTAELLAFPGRHDDQVDALTQGLAWARVRRGEFSRGAARGLC